MDSKTAVNQSIIAQATVREQSAETVQAIKDTATWIADIKHKEREMLLNSKAADLKGTVEQQVDELEKLPPVRSEVDRYEQYNQLPDPKTKADVFKESGNRIMKESNNYGEAVHYYTKAIACYDQEPTYFFNRGMCYKRLGSYQDSLTDFDTAIALNDKYSKAYFNRMKVLMELQRYDLALKDYNKVCELTPGEKRLMKREYDVLLEKTAPKKEWSVWSSKPGVKLLDFVEKAPHLRSKKPMRRLPITEMISPSTSHTYSDAVIDKLFNNNTGEYTPEDDEPRTRFSLFNPYYATPTKLLPQPMKATVQPTTPQPFVFNSPIAKVVEPKPTQPLNPKPVEATATTEELIDFNIDANNLPPIPHSVQQFYTTWSELKDAQKFLYLQKLVAFKDFGQLLGASFDSDTLSDLLRIMSVYFVKHNVPVDHLMTEISKNEEFKIISMWLSENDKKAIGSLIGYLEQSKCDATTIELLKKRYQEA